MARIRTIKPEFPQSEHMGAVSREARLCFILLWTQADDAGRLRGNSRMLASILYPYDDDARDHIEGWLQELAGQGCITRYEAGGASLIQINAWTEHQKIDRPSPSKLPPAPSSASARADSRSLASPREDSAADQGEDQGREGRGEGALATPPEADAPAARAPAAGRRQVNGTCLPEDWTLPAEWRNWALAARPDLDPDAAAEVFADHWRAQPGARGRKADWLATWRNWVRNERAGSGRTAAVPPVSRANGTDYDFSEETTR